jgi:hypothetical protein
MSAREQSALWMGHQLLYDHAPNGCSVASYDDKTLLQSRNDEGVENSVALLRFTPALLNPIFFSILFFIR